MLQFCCDFLEWFFLAMLPLACSLWVLRHYFLQSCFETICIAKKRKEKEWGEYSQCGFRVWFLNKAGYVLAGWVRLLVAVRRKTLLFFEAMMPGRRFSVQAFVCVKMPTRLSCFIMPAGGSSTVSASSWRVMDRGRKEKAVKVVCLDTNQTPLCSPFFALVPCFLDFMSLSKVFQTHFSKATYKTSPFCSKLSSPSTNTRLSTWTNPLCWFECR